MALDANRLGDAMAAAVAANPTNRQQAFRAMAQAIIDEIQDHGQVSVTGTTASGCSAGGATGTCTATGSVT